jgi:two-component system sensor histidine kinase DesK
MPRPTASLRWADRTPIERVRLYTVGSLLFLFVLLIALALGGALSSLPGPGLDVFVVLLAVVLVAGGLVALHAVLQRGEPRRPGRLAIGLLLGGAFVGQAVAWTRPSESGFAITLLVVFALAWGLGGMDDRRVWWAVVAVSPVLAWSTSRELGDAAGAAVAAACTVFTVRSSLWLLGVVEEVEAGRRAGAALAVAEERLRFSRDVHDVLGRRLSEIAVQAELARAYVVRGDERAAGTLSEVRATAHTALREARELARGYRPVDLGQELEGAAALLRSAGIEIRADLDGLPQPWAEPVARVVREAVTNVLRHSRATWVSITYHDGVVAVRNDGVIGPVGSGGSGLVGLGELVAPLRARLDATSDGDHFELRVVPEERP